MGEVKKVKFYNYPDGKDNLEEVKSDLFDAISSGQQFWFYEYEDAFKFTRKLVTPV